MSEINYDQMSHEQLVAHVRQLSGKVAALESRKKYGLVWDEKPEVVVEECRKKFPVLEEVSGKAIELDADGPVNLLIEGDNYHALSVLNYTHVGKIDVIYIDPPYNTGATDWKYNNNFIDKNDGYRHSTWLSMMKSRLKLAKNLLKKDGVMICAIDENERPNLELLLIDMFPGYEVVCVSVVHNPQGVQGKNFSYSHEYAIFVIPVKDRISKVAVPPREETFRDDTGNSCFRHNARGCFYPIIVKDGAIVGFGDVLSDDLHPAGRIVEKDDHMEIWPIRDGVERKWVFAQKTVHKIQDDLFLKNTRRGVDVFRRISTGRPKTVWVDPKYSAGGKYGTKFLQKILPKGAFNFPKSLHTVLDALAISAHKDATVLDFFAGSGTTGHAVMHLNAEDGGNRRFILCTNNENNIARGVCYPRIKKVMSDVVPDYEVIKKEEHILHQHRIDSPARLKSMNVEEVFDPAEKIRDENRENFDRVSLKFKEGILSVVGEKTTMRQSTGFGGRLRYFKTRFVDYNNSDKSKRRLADQAGAMLCIKEDTYEEVKGNGSYKIYRNGDRYTGIVYYPRAIGNFKKAIKKIDGKFSVYVFSLGGDRYSEHFADMNGKVVVKSIPQSIVSAYQRIFTKKG